MRLTNFVNSSSKSIFLKDGREMKPNTVTRRVHPSELESVLKKNKLKFTKKGGVYYA